MIVPSPGAAVPSASVSVNAALVFRRSTTICERAAPGSAAGFVHWSCTWPSPAVTVPQAADASGSSSIVNGLAESEPCGGCVAGVKEETLAVTP